MNTIVLEKQKLALEKLLENKHFFRSGFCHLIAILYVGSILTYEESALLKKLLDSYYDENEEARRAHEVFSGFFWEPGNWEEREKWIISTIESIDLMLNQSKTT